ncbi:radical SAM protein [Archaeoglobus veneficus]|uniref:Radical SAM domain protein n=1 Tax=Archaeoglobus veneficus (strain DSM 11195 / SNP6) TaxID=693661 RepID=F2KMM5_ARCVS|nr:radical SAM protein [Archaeoglobus veneficus]AEA47222.1 Radical SAM domain protein [Archaeoglobus veneficus SNP6]
MKCEVCGCRIYSGTIPICPECAKTEVALDYARLLHPEIDTMRKGKTICRLCSNECSTGVCGLRRVVDGKRKSLVSSKKAILHAYEDPLPTNCCNSWFCAASEFSGTNLAVFYYGCGFDCLYCQNWEHKLVEHGKVVEIDEMVESAMNPRIKCICHFGGSPEPQLPFAIRFSEEVLKRRDVMVCWEWNGGAHTKLALKAAKLSYESRGTVKFDLKAWNDNLHVLLTGRSNRRTLENFVRIYEEYPDVLSATTLLVPYYVDEDEVENIARFIASLSEHIPYSLLVFHPDYRLNDMPVTPREQVRRCYNAARKHLKRVHVGNVYLIGYF